MMNKTTLSLLALLTLLSGVFLSSCRQEEAILGEDNFILAFTLTSDGKKYEGVMDGENNIRIMLPFEIDLEGATAEYKLSEGARIIPDPRHVKDWNSEQAFNVISQNNQSRTYVIRLVHNLPEADGDVKLTNDDEVAAFVTQGINHIKGRLIIGGTSREDSVTNIDALTSIKKVDYDIIVTSRYVGNDLSGLRNVKEIGGLTINREVPNLLQVELKSLEKVYGSIYVVNDIVHTLSLPKLSSINGDIRLNLGGVEAIDFPALKSVRTLSIWGGKISSVKARELTEVRQDLDLSRLNSVGFLDVPRLKSVNGSVTISGFKALNSATLPQLEKIGGHLTIQNNDNMGDVSLPSLTSVHSLIIQGNKHLTSLNLECLTSVAQDVKIVNAAIKSLHQVAIKNIGGALELSNLSELEGVKSFVDQMENIGGDIKLGKVDLSEGIDLRRFTSKSISLSDLPALGDLILPVELESLNITGKHNAYWIQVPVISGLKTVGKLTCSNIGYEELQEELTMPDLEKAETLSLSIHNVRTLSFPKLRSLNTLSLGIVQFPFSNDKENGIMTERVSAPLLETIADKMDFNAPHLKELDMPSLKSVKQMDWVVYWPFNQNLTCTDLNGLSALEHVESINFSSLKAFMDYSFARKAVENGSLKSVSTSRNAYNPTLQDLIEGKYVKP